MRIFKVFLLLIITSLTPLVSKEYSIGPKPKWVQDVSWEQDTVIPDGISQGEYYRLYNQQVFLGKDSVYQFRQCVIDLVDISGVEKNSQISIDFDPVYETIIFHNVELIRKEQTIDKIKDAKIQLLQRESDMDALLYDGAKTLNIILNDVRPGDTLLYSYTRSGFNPIFNNRFSNDYSLEWSIPVEQTYLRVVNNKSTKLYFNYLNREYIPIIVDGEYGNEFIWQVKTAKTTNWDSSTPSWYTPLSIVEITEFKSWLDLKRWAYKLFDQDYDKKKIKEVYNTLVNNNQNSEEKLFTIVRWVQDEVRYLGIESGVASHKPAVPELTLERRFGDCKDKSFLAVALLKEAGIKAWPVLVHTDYGKELDLSSPLTGLFNHAIVAIQLEDEIIWIDPTKSFQKGNVSGFSQPNYFNGLILDESSEAFVSMDPGPLDVPNFEVVYDIDLRYDIPTFEITYINRFFTADYQRLKFKSKSRDDIQDEYLNYYTRFYPDIESMGTVRTVDNEDDNIYKITKQYRVPGLWEVTEENSERGVNLYPIDLSSNISKPRDLRRTMPISLDYPLNVFHKIKARYGETQGEYYPDSFTISSDYIEFEFNSSFEDQVLTNTYSFKTLRDYVPVHDIDQYLEDIDSIREKIEYSYYTQFEKEIEEEPSKIGIPSRVPLVLILLVVVIFLFAVKRENKINEETSKRY